ncbi:MAG: class IV adenylate cyclase [Anaerolineaceae bacterium]|nr:class IV adenylate cyclase [Anaerolineaceae bacterium]
MDQEIEVKFLIKDYERLINKIKNLGLVCARPRTHELNLRYDTPDQGLVSASQVLRLRKDDLARLTFKGPGKLQEDVLTRKEIEVVVSDFEATHRLLEALGYQVVLIYEKYRANYLIDTLILSLDETPLGVFVELEGESPAQVKSAAKLLGLDWEQRINLSYSALLGLYNRNTANSFRDLSFEVFEGLQVTPAELGLTYADLSGKINSSMKLWKTLSKRLVFEQSPWIKLEEHQIELPDGRMLDRWIWIDTPDFVIVVAVDEKERFLVFEQTKYASPGITLAPVGGYIQPGEDPLAAARRELLEETGFEAEEWISLGSFMTDANRGNGRGHYFLAIKARKTDQIALSDDLEEQRLLTFSAPELQEALEQNRVKIITWQAAFGMALQRFSAG